MTRDELPRSFLSAHLDRTRAIALRESMRRILQPGLIGAGIGPAYLETRRLPAPARNAPVEGGRDGSA